MDSLSDIQKASVSYFTSIYRLVRRDNREYHRN